MGYEASGFYTKKKISHYRERDEKKRQAYQEQIAAYAKEKRVYLDECGLCHKLQRSHGYAAVGKRLGGLSWGKRKGRTNIIGAWSTALKLFGGESYQSTVNKTVFMQWLKQKLLSYLKEGMVVIMDNAPWHKGHDIKTLIESTGAKLIMFPPYSPDLNPIEHAWANLKQAIKSKAHRFENIELNIESQLQSFNQSNLASL